MSDVRDQDAPSASDESRTGPNPRGDFIWYELMTPDPDASKAFYDTVIGWDIEPRPAGEMDYRMIRRSDGGNAGGVLRITPDMASHGARPTWLGYINVDDVDATRASIEQAGGKTLMGPHDIPNVGRIAMMADPQGAPFYVMKPIPPANDPDGRSDVFSYSPRALQRCSWNELATSDPKAAIDFYTSRFGWTKGETMPMGDMGDYQLLSHRGAPLGAIMPKAADRNTRWRFYFRVEHIDTAKATVEAKGGTVVHGPIEVPGGDRVLIGTDPQGAEFALVARG
jgi:uncharacterized protein